MARLNTLPLLAALVCMLGVAQATLKLGTPSINCAPGSTPTTLKVTVTAGTVNVGGVNYGAPEGFRIEFATAAQVAQYGSFDAVPTNVKCIKVFNPSSNPAYNLGPGASTTVTLTPCGSVPVLYCGTTYVVRVISRTAIIGGVTYGEAKSEPKQCATAACTCTYTQGYWKTHPAAWPVTSVKLGTQYSYTKTQAIAIMNTPVAGNGLISLSYQLIAAKLNAYYGASVVQILPAIQAADALIGTKPLPPYGMGYLDPAAVSALVSALDDFNQGKNTAAPHC